MNPGLVPPLIYLQSLSGGSLGRCVLEGHANNGLEHFRDVVAAG